MWEIFYSIIERDAYNSLLYSVLGGLFLLSTFHLVMFFQNGDRSYLLYSFYTFFSFLAYIPVVESGFFRDFSNFYHLDFRSKELFTIYYNSLYFLFFTHFLDVKITNKLWYKIIVYPALAFMLVGTAAFLPLRWGNNSFYFSVFYKIFIVLVTIHTLLSFYILTKIKNKLKYYIIVGGVVLFICSMIGESQIRNLPFVNLTKKTGDFIYFMGLFLENMAFSFALGHKQRNILRDKVSFNHNYIAELKTNEQLKDKINRENEKRLQIENKQMKYLQQISELKLSVLQTQMNPHFIFNALNSIKFYILENDTEIAVDYLTKFSKVIRTILIASTVKEFTLNQELQTMKIYVDIENLRFHHELDFQISIDPKINKETVKIPPMVLQPFIENAILHGVAEVENKKINIDINLVNDRIVIWITDNGVGREYASNHLHMGKSLGSKIAEGMLKNYFGEDNYHLSCQDLYSDDKPMGTRVILEFPAP